MYYLKLASLFTLCSTFFTMQYAMEGMSVTISFLSQADYVSLKESHKYVHTTVQFDPSRGNLEYFEDVCLIKRDCNSILAEAIHLMVTDTPFQYKYISGAKDVLTYDAKRRSLARKCIVLAVSYGATVDLESNKQSSLKLAVQHDDKELAEYLIENGANPNVGACPLYFNAQSFLVVHALAPKVNYSKRGPKNSTVLHHVMSPEFPGKFAQLYCSKYPSLASMIDDDGLTPLKRLMLEILKEGYDVDSATIKMKSILIALKDSERTEHANDALIFGQFRSRADLPGKEHRAQLKKLINELSQK